LTIAAVLAVVAQRMSAWSDRIRLGVIEEARGRQRRWRGLGLGLAVALVAIVAVAVVRGFSGGGGPVRFVVPKPGRVTGSLHALPVSDYSFWATPNLSAGNATVAVKVTGPGAQWGMTSCCNGPDGQTAIIGLSGPASVPAPVPFDELPTDVLLVSARVGAVRVNGFGTVGAVGVTGLQPGEKVVAFSVPQYAAKSRQQRGRSGGAPERGRPQPHQSFSRSAVCGPPPATETLTR